MLSCKQASQLLSQSLDRRLTWRERAGLKLHLMLCDVCKRFGRQIATIRMAVRLMVHAREQDQQVRLPPEAKARIVSVIGADPLN